MPLQAGFQDLARRAARGWREAVEVVAIDGVTGFKPLTIESLRNPLHDWIPTVMFPPRRRRTACAVAPTGSCIPESRGT